MPPPVRVVSIAGSDSSGGAGLQGDVKTISALGAYAATVVTAVTVQDTLGVHAVHHVPPDVVEAQLRVVLTDIGADAIKTGMLGSADVVRRVARTYDTYARALPLVVDPVLAATAGQPLLDRSAWPVLLGELVRRAAIFTPNIPEAELLTGLTIRSVEDFDPALDALLAYGASSVLLKGGHLPGDMVVDVLRTADGDEERYESRRIATTSTHGTGCALSSAIAVGLGEGLRLSDAVRRARAYVEQALHAAPGFGQGFGPLGHFPPEARAPLGSEPPSSRTPRPSPKKTETWH